MLNSSSEDKKTPFTTTVLVSFVCLAFPLSATVKACVCVCVFSRRQQDMPLWLCQFNYCCHFVPSPYLHRMTWEESNFLFLFKLHHTLWQDHLLTKRHGRLVRIYARHTCNQMDRTLLCPQQHHMHTKDKYTTWNVHPGDTVELKFTGVSSIYLYLICFSNWKNPCYHASYFYPRVLTPIFLDGRIHYMNNMPK